mgnify:CR=1 FL=1
MYVKCEDTFSYDWLANCLTTDFMLKESIPPLRFDKFLGPIKVNESSNRVKLIKHTLKIRDEGITLTKIYARLVALNKGLSTQNWQIYHRKVLDNEMIWLVVGLDEASTSYVKQRNGFLRYGTRTLRIRNMDEEKAGLEYLGKKRK